jgi:SAM-dependent methyltransferase
MRRVTTTVSANLPDWLYDAVKNMRGARVAKKQNLLGDRDIEWSWVAAHIPSGPGTALDFGPGGSYLGLIAAQRGYKVTAVDLEPLSWPYVHPNLKAQRGDLLQISLSKNHFDLVLNCSTVEHVGLSGRYGVTTSQPDGDLAAMQKLRSLMKPKGLMVLTTPVGSDEVFPPLTRVYGAQRLPLLLEGFSVIKEMFWIKDDQNKWIQTDRRSALSLKAFAGSWNPLKDYYGIGCFVLKRSKGK